MAMTQLDSIKSQVEAAARNAVNRGASSLRRDTSLVSQASRMTGKAFQAGEEAVRRAAGSARGRHTAPGETVATEPPPARPAEDGYTRRSPVQPIHEAADYRRRLVLRGVAAAALIAAACVVIYLLLRLNVFAW